MLKLHQICVTYGNLTALHNIDAEVNQGDLVAIVGANGCGKSTLFGAISGHIRLASGSITLADQPLSGLSPSQRAASISRLFQDPALNCVGAMTVVQNLLMARLRGRRAHLGRAMTAAGRRHVLSTLEENAPELLVHADTPMARLSGGQRQFVSFLMAILHQPKLLLLDEPTAALDPAAATRLLVFAKQTILNHGMTALAITHDPEMAKCLGNRLWVLEKGQLVRSFYDAALHTVHPAQMLGSIDYQQLQSCQFRNPASTTPPQAVKFARYALP